MKNISDKIVSIGLLLTKKFSLTLVRGYVTAQCTYCPTPTIKDYVPVSTYLPSDHPQWHTRRDIMLH